MNKLVIILFLLGVVNCQSQQNDTEHMTSYQRARKRQDEIRKYNEHLGCLQTGFVGCVYDEDCCTLNHESDLGGKSYCFTFPNPKKNFCSVRSNR